MPRHIFISFTNANDGKDIEYNSWYRDQHLPEVLSIPGFISGQRYRLSDCQFAGMVSPWKYMAIYQIEGESPAAALAELSRRISGGTITISDALAPDVAAWAYSPAGLHDSK